MPRRIHFWLWVNSTLTLNQFKLIYFRILFMSCTADSSNLDCFSKLERWGNPLLSTAIIYWKEMKHDRGNHGGKCDWELWWFCMSHLEPGANSHWYSRVGIFICIYFNLIVSHLSFLKALLLFWIINESMRICINPPKGWGKPDI